MDLRRDARMVALAALMYGAAPGFAAAQTPSDAYYHFLMGRHLEVDGNAAAALAALERAAAADPQSAEIRAEIAGLQYRRDMRDEAEKAAKAALALNPKNVEAHRWLGLIYANAAARERNTAAQVEMFVRDAITHLEQAIAGSQGPPDPNLNFTLGRMYTVANQPEKGIEALRRVLSQSPYSVQARLALAQAYAATGNLRSAISTLEEVADDSPVALEEMGKYQASAGMLKEAIATYTRGLQGQPNSRRLKLQRIAAALDDKQYQQAATFAADAVAQHADEPEFPR